MREFQVYLLEHKDLFIRLIITVVLILLNPRVRYLARKLIRRNGLNSGKSEVRILQISRLVFYIINIIWLIIFGIVWGVDPQSVLIVFSSLFTVIGVAMFAQWSILSNITVGIIIFFSMPFRVGDEIEIYDKDTPVTGKIESIMTFTIHIRTDNGDLVVLSNILLIQKILMIRKRTPNISKEN